jgi:hypothetical protein
MGRGSADSDATIWVQVFMACDPIIALSMAAHPSIPFSLGCMPPTSSAALVRYLQELPSDDGE